MSAHRKQLRSVQNSSSDDAVLFVAGQVVYTGTSSMDIQLTLRQSPSLEARIVAMFTFVARDPRTQKATKINPLVPQTNEQQQHFEQRARVAKALKAARKAAASGDGRMLSSNGEPVDPEQARRMEWAQELLAEARRMSRMPGEAKEPFRQPASSVAAS